MARASSIPWSRWTFSGLVLAKLTNDVVSLRFILFGLVGSLGLLVHLATLFIALDGFRGAVSGGAGRSARSSR